MSLKCRLDRLDSLNRASISRMGKRSVKYVGLGVAMASALLDHGEENLAGTERVYTPKAPASANMLTSSPLLDTYENGREL